jgi:hypothetical protein
LCDGISVATFEALLDVHLASLSSEEYCPLWRASVAGLCTVSARTFNSIVERKLLALIPQLGALLGSKDRPLVLKTLQICTKLFAKSRIFADCLVDVDFTAMLRAVVDWEDDEVRQAGVEVFCEWARASPAFGDADAAIFVDVRFADVFDEAPFPLKLRLIEICRILVEHLSGDAVVRVVNRAVIQAFAEIVESEEIAGMKELDLCCCGVGKTRRSAGWLERRLIPQSWEQGEQQIERGARPLLLVRQGLKYLSRHSIFLKKSLSDL